MSDPNRLNSLELIRRRNKMILIYSVVAVPLFVSFWILIGWGIKTGFKYFIGG